jgi:hypothetical protein
MVQRLHHEPRRRVAEVHDPVEQSDEGVSGLELAESGGVQRGPGGAGPGPQARSEGHLRPEPEVVLGFGIRILRDTCLMAP